MKTWKEVWSANYNKETDIAKWVLSTTKETYKGDAYVPWGNMVHALYSLDDNAEIIKVQNERGGFVHTDQMLLHTEADGKVTVSTIVAHMVIVKVKFFDKWFTEVYPIQEKDYGASKVYDQNKVNKALQRAMARCISFATGIAWHLYENASLQFDDDNSGVTPPKPPTQKISKLVNNVSDEPVKNDNLVDFLINNAENVQVIALVEKFNQVLSSKYTFKDKPLMIDLKTDTEDILKEKLSLVSNPNTMLDALRKVVK